MTPERVCLHGLVREGRCDACGERVGPEPKPRDTTFNHRLEFAVDPERIAAAVEREIRQALNRDPPRLRVVPVHESPVRLPQRDLLGTLWAWIRGVP